MVFIEGVAMFSLTPRTYIFNVKVTGGWWPIESHFLTYAERAEMQQGVFSGFGREVFLNVGLGIADA